MSSTSTAPDTTLVGLECPVCLSIPRQEIYQCSNGHSICHICITKVEICLTCRVSSGLNQVRVRNHYAETFLDGMQFECCWKELDCDALLPRGQLSHHEIVCKYGPMNLCKAFERSENCQFQFLMMTLHNPEQIKEVLEHMKTNHNFALTNKVRWAQSRSLSLNQDQLDFETGTELPLRKYMPVFQEVVSGNYKAPSSELFVLLLNFEEDHQNQMVFSTAFAMLTSESDGTSLETIETQLYIKGQINAEVSETWGYKCVPDIVWAMKPMSAPKFKEFLEMPLEDRPPFPFSMLVSHIRKHYVDSNGIFTIQVSSHKE